MKEYSLCKIWHLEDQYERIDGKAVYLCDETKEISGQCILHCGGIYLWIMNPYGEVKLLQETDY